MNVYYCSDLHLAPGTNARSRRFVSFLQSIPQPGDLLLLGGDIFDLFVGNKKIFREQHAEVLAALSALAGRGVKVHYLEGNHDFHMRAVFAGSSLIEVHAEDFGLQANDKHIHLAHGDLIDPEDRGYRFLRWFTRTWFFRLFVRWVPDWVADQIGKWSSRTSRKYNSESKVQGEKAERLRRLFLEHARGKVAAGADFVLIGHSHLRDQLPILDSGRRGEYLNLGFSESLVFAVLPAGGTKFEAKEYRLS